MSERFFNGYENKELEVEIPRITRVRVTEGLEFGEGKISGQEADADTLRIVDETIHSDPEIIVAVDEEDGRQIDDDGCGDGRETGLVFRGLSLLKRGLRRPKVFGGALMMAAAAKIGVGRAKGLELQTVVEQSMDQLNETGVNFGAHTDDHAEGANCGCGAIDRAPEIVRAIVKYEQPIRGAIKALGVEDAELDVVYQNFKDYVATMPEQPEYSGRTVMDRIAGMGKIIKQLRGNHNERRIVINAVRGFTVNQELIRQKTDGKAQVFAVDSWRLQDIANKMYDGRPVEQQRALLSGLLYTIGTAAVLTKGDLPIDVIQPEPLPEAA
jgi:hypothetical protein